MGDVEIRTPVPREELREVVRKAIADQWSRDMRDRVERSPEGHQDALADAVMAAIP